VIHTFRIWFAEEDSVTFQEQSFGNGHEGNKDIEIAVIDLPHISNFTDFDALRNERCDSAIVTQRRIAHRMQSSAGKQNVIEDLAYLRQRSWIGHRATQSNCEIIGICGGYQMLGK
jgi:adenosylcobyric acid synthase